jgi:hypothetical protein
MPPETAAQARLQQGVNRFGSAVAEFSIEGFYQPAADCRQHLAQAVGNTILAAQLRIASSR